MKVLPRVLLAVAVLSFALRLPLASAAEPGKTQQLASPDQVPEGLAKSDWSSIRAAYEAGRHAFQPIEGGWQARNPGQQWTTKFDGRGFLAEPRDGAWQWGLELKGYGFGETQHAIGGTPAVQAEGQRLSYQWDATVQEWWVNDARGLEHGFTVAARPEVANGTNASPLSLTMATRGTLHPRVSADAQGVLFTDATGATVLNYTGLKVWDADGKVLASRFEAAGEKGVRLLVEERAAHYPLTIDPIAQQAYLKPAAVGTTQAADFFGQSVAVSGDTVVVGAPYEDSSTTGVNSTPNESATDSGAAYVFVRSAGVWTQEAYLKPAAVGTTQAGDLFGISVAVSGDTMVVGAHQEDSSTTGVNSTPDDGFTAANSGAAYVFVRSAGVWTQQAYLKPAAVGTTQSGDLFGFSVAVSGDTVVVGAPYEDSSTMGVNSTPDESVDQFGSPANSGAAYVFVRSAGVWTQQAYLKPAAVGAFQASDRFGWSVAVSGDTVVVGAEGESGSKTGVDSLPNDDGTANASGAAYVFVRSAGVWTQQAYLKPAAVGTTQADDRFGWSVAVSGDTVVVGAPYEDSSTTGVNSAADEGASLAGAAYTFIGLREIAVEQPVGTGLSSGIASIGTGGVPAGSSSAAKTFTIRNTGLAALAITSVSVNGGNAGDFIVNTTGMLTSVPAIGSTTFSVTFTPAAIGSRTTTLRIVNNDADEAAFDITLTGTGLSFTNDTDGDGLNDASEAQLAGLGFDWQVSQPSLVAALPGLLNPAGLYTTAQVRALNVGVPLLTKDAATGKFKLTIGVTKTTNLMQSFLAFPMTGAGVTTVINGAGKLEFEFTVPDNAAFFRLQAQ